VVANGLVRVVANGPVLAQADLLTVALVVHQVVPRAVRGHLVKAEDLAAERGMPVVQVEVNQGRRLSP
jgi:hypothetical protein